jgi:FkbM family methyltransferase
MIRQLIDKRILPKQLNQLYWGWTWLNSHPFFRKNPYNVLYRLFAWEIFKIIKFNPTINIHDYSKMLLQPGPRRGIHGLIYIFRNNYELAVSCVIERYVSSEMLVYDIGANIGLWTLRLAELVGDSGKVYAFEPIPSNINLLKQNILISSSSSRVEVVPYALGITESTAKMYIPVDPGSSSIFSQSIEDKVENVQVKRLDEIWENQGFPHISFVKIDVEGSEPSVLEGGSKFFETARPVVVCEIISEQLMSNTKGRDYIFHTFQSWGYDSFIFDTKTNSLIQSDSKQNGDIVFIPRNDSNEEKTVEGVVDY